VSRDAILPNTSTKGEGPPRRSLKQHRRRPNLSHRQPPIPSSPLRRRWSEPPAQPTWLPRMVVAGLSPPFGGPNGQIDQRQGGRGNGRSSPVWPFGWQTSLATVGMWPDLLMEGGDRPPWRHSSWIGIHGASGVLFGGRSMTMAVVSRLRQGRSGGALDEGVAHGVQCHWWSS
jgi:hypothetical protein